MVRLPEQPTRHRLVKLVQPQLPYDAGFVDVYLNGVKLVNGTDFTATNGTLTSAAAYNWCIALNDIP